MVEVTYRGGNMDGITSNAASEATLQKLVAALGKSGGGAKGLHDKVAGKTADELKKLTKASKEAKTATTDDTASTKEHTDAVEDSIGAFKKLGRSIGSMFGSVTGAAGGLVGSLLEGEMGLSNYTSHVTGLISQIPGLGILGPPLQGLVNAIDQNIESTRQLNQVGGDLGEGLFGAQLAAAEARMSLDSFTSLMGDQSQNLSASFGGASKGMKEFATMMGGVKKMDKQFAALGYTVDEQAEFTAEYIELQRSQGLWDSRQQRKNIKGAQDYLLQLDQLTKITGMSRKQAAAELKAQADDKRLTAILHNMDEGTKANLQGALAQVQGLSPELGDAMKEMVATGGVPISDMGKSMLLLNPKLAEMSKGLADGSVSQTEFADEIKRTKEMAVERMKTEGKMMSAAAALGNPIYDAVFAFGKVAEVGGTLTEAQEAQAKQMEDEQKQVMNFQQTITDLRNTIMTELINSGVFDQVVGALGNLTKWMADPEKGGGKIKDVLGKISTAISTFLTDVQSMNLKELFTKYISVPLEGLGISIPTWVSNMIFGKEANAEVEASKAKVKELQALVDEAKAAGKSYVEYADGTKVALADVEKEIAATKEKIDKDEAGGGGWWTTLIDNIGLIGTVVGGTLAAGGVAYLAVKGFSLLLSAFGTGPVALGAAVLVGLFVGTGYAIKLAGEGINYAGDGVKKVSDALNEMSQIKDVANLKEVGGVMGEVADSLMQFAVGGAIMKLVGSGGLKDLAGAIEGFNTIDGTKLKEVGPGIAALYEGTSKFTGDGAWEGFSKWVGSLFGGSSNDFEKMAQGIKHFEGIDGSKLASLGGGLSGIAEFVAAINTETELKEQVAALNSLINVMGKYQKQYNKMSSDMQASFNMAVNNSGKETVEALNELNTVIKQLVTEQQESNKIGNKIVGAVNEGGAIG